MNRKNKIKFKFPISRHEHPLTDSETESFLIKPRPLPVDWAEANLELVSPGYVFPGPYRAYHWQREIINAMVYWDTVLMVGVPQTGKSVNTDIDMYYAQAVLGLNGMVAYANKDTVESVFKLRITDMIQQNEVLRKNWSGKDDDLTVSNLKLKNCLWRVASAQNKNDLATFSAAISIGSEVAKWEKMSYNPVLMLRGRQGAFTRTGECKTILESSPYEESDYLYKEAYKSGTIILHPHYPCPVCGEYQEWTDYQIKLRSDKEENSHSPERIRAGKEESARYECIYCNGEITEQGRALVDNKMVWAAPEIDREDFYQSAEIIGKDGSIQGRLEGGRREGFDSVCYQWSRLIDVSFSFYKCLALFFETKNDPETKKVYENETMGRWQKRTSRKMAINYLEDKKDDYYQYGDKHVIPDDVLMLTFGGDTQDNGFFYTVFGWGYGLLCRLIRHDFISLPITENMDHQECYIKFKNAIIREPLRWADGTEADWKFGFLDRGGHRSEDVDYISTHMHNIEPYIGLAKIDEKKPVIYKSEKGNFYLGQSELLSDFTGTLLSSESTFFPADVTVDFLQQVGRQFREKRISRDGRVSEVWVHGHKGADHYRDCFNLAWAAAKHLNLDKILFNRAYCETLAGSRVTRGAVKEHVAPTQKRIENSNFTKHNDGYFSRAFGRSR